MCYEGGVREDRPEMRKFFIFENFSEIKSK